MKILSLNYRGCNNTPTVRHLRTLVSIKDPDTCFLFETKATANLIVNINNKLEYQSNHVVPSTDKARGLALLWHKEINIAIISSSKHNIEACIIHGPNKI